jgi:hypothetical protein
MCLRGVKSPKTLTLHMTRADLKIKGIPSNDTRPSPQKGGYTCFYMVSLQIACILQAMNRQIKECHDAPANLHNIADDYDDDDDDEMMGDCRKEETINHQECFISVTDYYYY